MIHPGYGRINCKFTTSNLCDVNMEQCLNSSIPCHKRNTLVKMRGKFHAFSSSQHEKEDKQDDNPTNYKR